MTRFFRLTRCPLFLLLAVWASGAAVAQSDGGLKLGEPAAKDSLDLGTGSTGAAQREALSEGSRGSESAEGSATGGNASAVQRTTHGDWEVACPPEGKGCAMAQIGEDKSGTPVLEMVIRKLPEPLEVGERTAIAVLDVITPLGVVLTEGLSVTIDKGRTESAPFQICTEQGCLVREPIDADLINRLKRGGVARVAVVAANQGEVAADLSLRGFTKAYDGID